MSIGEVSCLAGSATMHTILRERYYSTNFVPKKAPLTTLSGLSNLIKGYGKAHIMLSNGIVLTIKEVIYSPCSGRTLLSFKRLLHSVGIDVKHPVPHVNTQNGLAEAFIKRLQLIAQTLVMRTKLSVSAKGYTILHTTMLVLLRPTTTQPHSPLQLVTRYEFDV
ncbi:hypothetical protein ACFX1T_037914 [Malus domestica]